MIEITQATARRVRAVVRKSLGAVNQRVVRPVVVFQAGKEGLLVRGCHDGVGVEYAIAGASAEDIVALPLEALRDFEGRKEVPVTLEKLDCVKVRVSWDDAGVPQQREYTQTDTEKLPPWPELPRHLIALEAGFLGALADATETAARDAARYALSRIQLRGEAGQVVATDGRQLLVQAGFTLPWKEEVLVPALGAFGCRELPQQEPASIGRTETHVCFRVGPWTFLLPIDKDGRFPRAENVIPSATGKVTVWRLSEHDADFLARTLPKLPSDPDANEPVTLDLNGHAMVRAKSEGQSRVTEVVLKQSEVVGPAVCFVTNRRYLERALQLGFTEFQVVKEDVPVVCRKPRITYVWMPLGKTGALPATDDALQITSPDDPTTQPSPPAPPKARRTTMPTSSGSDNGRNHAPQTSGAEPSSAGSSLAALIQEAESLHEVSRETCRRLSRLVAALKKHRKQTRLMTSTLASLKQLQQLQPVDG